MVRQICDAYVLKYPKKLKMCGLDRAFACLCILHQSCLTITAGTANCPIFRGGGGGGGEDGGGGLGSSLHLLWRELGL